MKYCAIEGSSYVGKTTVAFEIERAGIVVVPEYDSMVNLNSNQTSASLIRMADLLLEAERARSQIASRANGDIVISDRSVMSFFTFYDASIRFNIGNSSEALSAKEYMSARLEDEVNKGNILLNNCAVVMRIDNENEFRARVEKRGITPITQLANYAVAQYIADRTVKYSHLMLGEEATAELNVSGMDIDTSVYKVLDKISTLSVRQ